MEGRNCRSAAAALLLGILFATAPARAVPEPMRGEFTDDDLDRAQRLSVETPLPTAPGWEATDKVREERDLIEANALLLNSTDDDATHYARGSTLIIHVFVNHSGGTWSTSEMNDAGARARTAKDYYLENAPADANLHFDFEGTNGYYYYNPTVNYNIPNDGMGSDQMEDALAALGQGDNDGDTWRIDDFSVGLQDWGGGWDNVIVCFEPADITGRAWASYAFARTALYTDDTGNVFAHEWGHLFGSCDEYVEGGECNGGINCGDCQSTYLDDIIDNGNCQLASCPSDVSCIMINNTFNGICNYTLNHWGWIDEDSDGILDWVKRRTTGNNFVEIYEIPHNGYALWNNTTDGYAVHQKWNTWSAIGLRSPSGSDYDMQVYGDNSHNYLLASSSYAGQTIDFVVSDYNHDRPGNEHVQVNLYSGSANNYRLHWESGTGMLYPNGVASNGAWQSYYVVRTFDVPLFGGETVTFTLDIVSGSMDLGMALFKSNGSYYHVGRSSAQWVRDAGAEGVTETWTYTVPSDDVYGLVLFANNAASGDFSIKIGPTPYSLSEEVPFNSALDLRLYDYAPNAFYWSFIGTRPESGTNVSVRLFGDVSYQTELATSDDYSGLEFVAADYNPSYSTDYVRVIRESGSGTHATEWEHDGDIIAGAVSESWTSGHVGKVWDAYLLGGDTYFLREYHSGSLDTGIYLFGSDDGDRYKQRNDYDNASNFRPGSDGGEWFLHTPTATDYYGIYQIVNDETTGSYSLWLGPREIMDEDEVVTRTDEILWGRGTTTAAYWTAFGVRPATGATASAWLYGDDAYTITTLAASDQSGSGVNYVVADLNHAPTGLVYPRFRRTSGSGAIDCEWEGGANAIVHTPGTNQSFDLDWPPFDVVEVYDLYVDGGVSGGRDVQIMVQDLTGTKDFGIALFASSGAAYYSGSNGAVASADSYGAGGTETFQYHLTTTDWFGLVVFNQNDAGGSFRLKVIDPATASAEDPADLVFDLRPLSTNPFNGEAQLRYSVPTDGAAELAVFDVAGRRVRSLVQQNLKAGSYTAIWDGRDEAGVAAPSGIYFARFRAGKEDLRVKLVRSQ